MDRVIASYDTDQAILNGIVKGAIWDNFGGSPEFQGINQDQTTITNSEDLKIFYENTLQLPDTLEISALKQGEVIIADATELRDEDGLGTLNYQWYADDILIDGATGEQFTLTQNEVGKEITVEVSYNDLNGTAEKMTSMAAPIVGNVNDDPIGKPEIIGDLQQDQTLTVKLSNISDADGIDPGNYDFQWLANGSPINGAIYTSLELGEEYVGKKIIGYKMDFKKSIDIDYYEDFELANFFYKKIE